MKKLIAAAALPFTSALDRKEGLENAPHILLIVADDMGWNDFGRHSRQYSDKQQVRCAGLILSSICALLPHIPTNFLVLRVSLPHGFSVAHSSAFFLTTSVGRAFLFLHQTF